MAVDFSQLPSEALSLPTPPSRMRWTIVFFVLLLLGMFAVLYLWPKGMPTQTLLFWVTLVLFPLGVAGWVILRRFSVYEGRKLDALLAQEAAQAFNARVFQAASVPLAVMGAALRFSTQAEACTAAHIADGAVTLKVQEPIASAGAPVKARWLNVPEMPSVAGGIEEERKRYRYVTVWLFNQLLDELLPSIQALPSRIALTVQLSVSNGFTHEENSALWRACWQARPLRAAAIAATDASHHDLMMLDHWLDAQIVGERLHATLVIAVQLHPLLAATPKTGVAEAAAALLLMPTSLLQQQMPVTAYLHRPVQSPVYDAGDALAHAIRWAGLNAAQIQSGWQTGLDATQSGALREPAQQLELGVSPIDLDQTVGAAGIAAPWLALACAVATSVHQLVLVGYDGQLDVAVVKPTHQAPTVLPDHTVDTPPITGVAR